MANAENGEAADDEAPNDIGPEEFDPNDSGPVIVDPNDIGPDGFDPNDIGPEVGDPPNAGGEVAVAGLAKVAAGVAMDVVDDGSLSAANGLLGALPPNMDLPELPNAMDGGPDASGALNPKPLVVNGFAVESGIENGLVDPNVVSGVLAIGLANEEETDV